MASFGETSSEGAPNTKAQDVPAAPQSPPDCRALVGIGSMLQMIVAAITLGAIQLPPVKQSINRDAIAFANLVGFVITAVVCVLLTKNRNFYLREQRLGPPRTLARKQGRSPGRVISFLIRTVLVDLDPAYTTLSILQGIQLSVFFAGAAYNFAYTRL